MNTAAKRDHYTQQLVREWVKVNRPDVWDAICALADKKFPRRRKRIDPVYLQDVKLLPRGNK